ncbi:MAG: MraY family glycosyltransferase [Gemmatimonadaceae bacterium]
MLPQILSPTEVLVQHLAALLLGFGLTAGAIPWIIRFSLKYHLLDEPDGDRRIHTVAVPRLGGVALFAGTAVTAALLMLYAYSRGVLAVPYPRLLPGIVLGAAIVFITGIFDDLRGVPPRAKLAAQTLAALAVVAYGFQIDTLALSPTSAVVSLGILSIPITLLWIVGMTNAFNLIDGIDGLAGTVAMIAIVTSMGVDLYLHDYRSLFISTAMLGALFGFLRYNNSPARIFLGDSGSMTIGFFLSIRVVISATTADGRLYVLVPIFALAFPLLDTAIAIARRWLRGHPFSRADGRHIHHQVLALGLGTRQTVNILGFFFAGVAALGLSVSFAPPEFTLAFMVAAAALLFASFFYGSRWLQYEEFAELGNSIASVVRNARVVVREKILANEIAAQIRNAKTLDEVRILLGTLVDDVRVLDVELIAGDVHVHGPERQQISPVDQLPVRLDYPFAWHTEGGVREVILRLWSARPRPGGHPATERVATRIGPALEDWFQRNSGEATPVFGIEAVPQARRTPKPFFKRSDG